MSELLKSFYDIEYKDILESSLTNQHFDEFCYERIMNEKIYELVGVEKIDSLWKIAQRNCFEKFPDSIWIENGYDIRNKFK